MNKEEIKFDFNEDIVFQIEMMSYMEYNGKLCSINEHLGEIYGYQDLKDTEEAQLHYEKELSYKAIKQLQKQLQQKENIIEEVREYLKIREADNSMCSVCSVMSDYLLQTLDKENIYVNNFNR